MIAPGGRELTGGRELAERFRRIALELPGAIESAHMGHPDFRAAGRIFATLSGQQRGLGVLKLTPEQQAAFLSELPAVFEPVQGGWGRMGMTYVHLDAAEATLRGALVTAHRNVSSLKTKSRRRRADADVL